MQSCTTLTDKLRKRYDVQPFFHHSGEMGEDTAVDCNGGPGKRYISKQRRHCCSLCSISASTPELA